MAPGWYSGMAQVLASSVLMRAALVARSEGYADAAVHGMQLMLAPTQKGGCAIYDASGGPFIEDPSDPPSYVLNGALFSVISLIDTRSPDDERAGAATARIARMLPMWDIGYWTRYDLRRSEPASPAYHALHIAQARVLGAMTGDHSFEDNATRWLRRLRRPVNQLRAIIGRGAAALRHGW